MLKLVTCRGERHMLGGEGSLFFGDLRAAAPELKKAFGGARVVYIDPPFGTGRSFDFRRGGSPLAYKDALGAEEYAELIRSAVRLSHELLAEDGTFFLHIDYRMSALCRNIADEIFGAEAFTNEIIWVYRSGGRTQRSFARKHDNILMYRKSPGAYFNIAAVGVPRGPERRNHMKRGFAEDGRAYRSIVSGGREYRYFDDEPVFPSDVWDDIEHLHQRDPERTGFVTQKPEALLKRIILACSEPGDTVVDLFGGSGTTAAAAAKCGRRFASVDCGVSSLAVTRRRLIERCLTMPIYEKSYELDVIYAEPLPQAEPASLESMFDIKAQGGELTLALRSLSDAETPYFAAVGRMQGDIFSASDYPALAGSGAKITLRPGEALLITGPDMTQGVYAFEE